MDDARHAPATARNRAPLEAVLKAHLPRGGDVLEIGSGTGEHAAYFAERFPELTFQPTDVDAGNHASIRASACVTWKTS